MEKDDTVYLRHILDAINTIGEYLQGVNEDKFKATRLLQDGAIRQIEIIGEAVRHMSKDIRKTYPEIPWQDVAGMRDKLIHDYSGIIFLCSSLSWEQISVKVLPKLLCTVNPFQAVIKSRNSNPFG